MQIIYLLHAVLKPGVFWIKRNHRPGICESRDSMVMHVKNQADVHSSIAEFRKTYQKLNLRVQPFVIAIGPTLISLTKFLTVVDNLILEFDSLANALDSCFKSVFVFSLEFQPESARVWRFFQEYFFWPVNRTKQNAQLIMLSKSMKSRS
jgi:hypothetical protein